PTVAPTASTSISTEQTAPVGSGQIAVGAAPTPTPSVTAHVDLTQGTAQWRAAGQTAFQPVTGSFDLPVGGEIRTDAQGQATLAFPDGSRIGLDRSSQVLLESFDVDGTTPDTITARLGRMRIAGGNVTFD